MVSIIIPVYNVEDCIDRCVESLIKQTFTDIEILLINDGSTDCSYEKCLYWAEQDTRIRVFTKQNEGLGKTRNFGVLKSQGDYILYVDSDDWVNVTLVEKLMNAITMSKAELAVCDRYNYQSSTNVYEEIKNDVEQSVLLVEDDKQCIFNISTVAWGKLYKKSLLIDNGIYQPDCEFEDIITPVTMALATRIAYVAEPLYYYWTDRKGSITNNMNFMSNIRYLEVLIDEFCKRGIYEKYKIQIEQIIKYRMSWNLECASKVVNIEKARLVCLLKEYKALNEKFLADNQISYDVDCIHDICVIGSYNLMIVAKMLTSALTTETIKYHYSFSNLISMMSKTNESLLEKEIDGVNEYRKNHLISDISKSFVNMQRTQMDACNVVLIDFLEDRFPIGRCEDCYITLSDAFYDSSLSEGLEYEDIKITDEEYWSLWQQKCDKFVRILKNRYKDKTVVLVKMKLTQMYGKENKRHRFENSEHVELINQCLEKEYQYFMDNYDSAKVIEVEDLECFYTDEEYRHGCYPWHLNADMYKRLRTEILKGITRDGR